MFTVPRSVTFEVPATVPVSDQLSQVLQPDRRLVPACPPAANESVPQTLPVGVPELGASALGMAVRRLQRVMVNSGAAAEPGDIPPTASEGLDATPVPTPPFPGQAGGGPPPPRLPPTAHGEVPGDDEHPDQEGASGAARPEVPLTELSPQFFEPASDLEMTEFREASEALERVGPPPDMLHFSYVRADFGDVDGPHITVQCRLDTVCERTDDSVPLFEEQADITMTVASGPMVPENGEPAGPAVTFSNGRTRNEGMDHTEFMRIVQQVKNQIHPATWEWLRQVQRYAEAAALPWDISTAEGGAAEDAEFRPFMAAQLLGRPPEHDMTIRRAAVTIQDFWQQDQAVTSRVEDANLAYRLDQGDSHVARELTVTAPDGATYVYRRYGRQYESMMIVARSEAQREAFLAEGLPATTSHLWDWSGNRAPQERPARPTALLARRFTRVLTDMLRQDGEESPAV